MSHPASSSRRIARRLTSLAAHVLPHKRADWAQAMVNELEHIPDDHPALRWAIGCLITSFFARATLMIVENISMRQVIAILLLSVVGLLLVYGGLVAAEAVSVTPLALFLGNDVGVPGTLIRIVVLLVTAAPIAYLTGYGLTRWVPALSFRIIPVVALLITLLIALFQVYAPVPSLLGTSILMILSVAFPLALAAYRNRPEHVT